MSPFSEKEIEYLRGRRLGRLATLGSDGSPHVVPVGYRVGDDDAIELGGRGFATSKKWRDMQADQRVAFVVDDFAEAEPPTPRGIEIRGLAELHTEGGEKLGPGRDQTWIRIVPERIVAWGIDGAPYAPRGRSVS